MASLALVPVERVVPRFNRLLAAAAGLEHLGEIAPPVSLPRETVGLLQPCHRLAGETFRLRVLATMRENARLYLPPGGEIHGIVSGELLRAAGERFGLVELAEGAQLSSSMVMTALRARPLVGV